LDHQERCLRFLGSETKSGRDEPLDGGKEGWKLLQHLETQARRHRIRPKRLADSQRG
jgi:hypothetical protein